MLGPWSARWLAIVTLRRLPRRITSTLENSPCYSAAAAGVATGDGLSSRRRGNTSSANKVMLATLSKHQQVAEAADAVVERLDLVVHISGRTGEAGAALDQLLDRRRPLVDRIAVAVADKAATLAAGFERR